MKKLFTTLALAGAVVFGANAQKNVDLALTITQPENDQNFPNVAAGGTFQFILNVTNQGTDDVSVDDTLQMYSIGYAYLLNGSGSVNLTWTPLTVAGYEIPAGETLALTLDVTKGDGYLAGPTDTVVFHFPDDALAEFWFTSDPDNKMSYYFDIFGYDASGVIFNDPDITIEGGEVVDWSGNNIATVKGISFGTASSIFDINGLDKYALNLYPNPTSQNLNFTQNFTNTTSAVVNIFDITGKLVMTQDFGTQYAGTKDFQINVSDLSAGNYTLEFVTNENRGVSKFTVAK